jgi:hypothetical protein
MAHISEYSIVTYERKPGHWRAAIIPKARFGIAVRGDKVLSFVTPDDYATESEARFAAQQAIRKLWSADDRWFRNHRLARHRDVIGGDHLREFLYLIRNSFFVPKVEQALWFAGSHRFNYSLAHRGWWIS